MVNKKIDLIILAAWLFIVPIGTLWNRYFEAESRDFDKLFIEIMHEAAEAHIIADENGKIIFATPGVLEVTGYTSDELRQKDIKTLIPDRYLDKHTTSYLKFVNTYSSQLISMNCYLKKKDNTEINVETRIRMVEHPGYGIIVSGVITPSELVQKVNMQ